MTDIISCFQTILDGGWSFLTKTEVPGLGFSFAVLLIGLAVVPLGFKFLSIALGFSVGHVSSPVHDYGTRGSKKYNVSDSRKSDVR